jgi:hypothetical protein
MFFFVMGNKVSTRKISSTTKPCPRCDDPGPHSLLEANNYVTIYFLPVFKLNRVGTYYRCSKCGYEFGEGQSAALRASREPDWTWTCIRCENVNPSQSETCLKCQAAM